MFYTVHTFTYYLLIVILPTVSSSGNLSCLSACLLSSFIFHPSCLHYLPCHLSLSSSSVFILLSFCFHISFLIRFDVLWWTPFSNNDACCIWLTLVLIEFALFFCFSNHFINVLLGLMCISVLSALCIVISRYSSLVQWVIYCKSITFIILYCLLFRYFKGELFSRYYWLYESVGDVKSLCSMVVWCAVHVVVLSFN